MKMKAKKIIPVFFVLSLTTSFLFSQSLVETAKKERERRESLKGKKVTVVTNADLRKVKKKTAVSAITLQSAEKEAALETKGEPALPPEKEENVIPDDEKSFRQAKAALEEKLNKAQELSSLYETKMNGLLQEFNSFDDIVSRDKIQREMSETQQKLKKGREDEVKAKEELDKFLVAARKKGIPPGWLR